MTDSGIAYNQPFGFDTTSNDKAFNSLDYKIPNDNKLSIREGDLPNGYLFIGDDVDLTELSIIKIGDLPNLISSDVLNNLNCGNMFIGKDLLEDATSAGCDNILIGFTIGGVKSSIGDDNIYIGNQIEGFSGSASLALPSRTIAIGHQLKWISQNIQNVGNENIIIGSQSGAMLKEKNICIGALNATRPIVSTATGNILIGDDVVGGTSASTSLGDDNILIGSVQRNGGCSGNRNISMGDSSRRLVSGDDNIFIGFQNYDLGADTTTNNNIAIGAQTASNGGKLGEGNITIGSLAASGASGSANANASNNICIGLNVGRDLLYDTGLPADIKDNVLIGSYQTGRYISGDGIVALGNQAAEGNATIGGELIETGAVAIGEIASRDGAKSGSIKIGLHPDSNKSFTNQISLGWSAGRASSGSADNSIYIGEVAGGGATTHYDRNIVLCGVNNNTAGNGDDRCFIEPIRERGGTDWTDWKQIYYDPTTKEMVYDDT